MGVWEGCSILQLVAVIRNRMLDQHDCESRLQKLKLRRTERP